LKVWAFPGLGPKPAKESISLPNTKIPQNSFRLRLAGTASGFSNQLEKAWGPALYELVL
jgi:hypothetical protein